MSVLLYRTCTEQFHLKVFLIYDPANRCSSIGGQYCPVWITFLTSQPKLVSVLEWEQNPSSQLRIPPCISGVLIVKTWTLLNYLKTWISSLVLSITLAEIAIKINLFCSTATQIWYFLHLTRSFHLNLQMFIAWWPKERKMILLLKVICHTFL